MSATVIGDYGIGTGGQVVFETATGLPISDPFQDAPTLSVTIQGSNTLLLVIIAGVFGQIEGLAANFNGTALTHVASGHATSTERQLSIFRLINPDTGAHTLSVSRTPATGTWQIAALCFSGVNQTAPLGTPVSNEGDSAAPTVTVSSSTGAMVVGAVNGATTYTYTAGGGQTERYEDSTTGVSSSITVSTEAGAGSVVMSHTASGSGVWFTYGVSINP